MERTDNDTWDLASSVGATATMVAAARAVATNSDDPLIDDPFAETLVRAVGVNFFTRWATGELNAGDVDDDGAGWGLQRMTHLLAARTRYFDQFFLDATTAGIRQAVILASGLDARAYRLPWPSGMRVFEIDQPEVIEFKTTTLTGLGARPTADLRPLAIDLRHDWVAAIRAAGFDTEEPTAWIAEGLLGFLPPDAQDRLLDNITTLSAAGSRLATETFANPANLALDRVEETMRTITQRWRDHGFDLEMSDLGYPGDRNDVAQYLNTRGWESVGTPIAQLLAANGLPPLPRHDGEEVTFAQACYYTSILK
jgi:methyltransferase (TIGR00027 family)